MGAWQIPEMWKGGEAWILGGGPSLTTCFDIPQDIVNEVRFKKKGIDAYSPFLAAIHSKHVIGINVAYQLGDWLDICFFGDNGFFLAHGDRLSQWPKLKVSCATHTENLNWVKYLPWEKKRGSVKLKHLGISSYSKAVSWNWNSGAASISLAAWLGVKRIVLVGFDMKANVTNNHHFHNLYNGSKPAFNNHLRGFPVIKSDADNLGIEILNTSLDSAITAFPKVHIKELL